MRGEVLTEEQMNDLRDGMATLERHGLGAFIGRLTVAQIVAVARRLVELEEASDRSARAASAFAADLREIARLCQMTDDEYPLRAVQRMAAEVAKLRAVVEAARGFVESVEAAESDAQWRAAGRKGMGVDFHGDFARVDQLPSVRRALNQWARTIRAALDQAPPKGGE